MTTAAYTVALETTYKDTVAKGYANTATSVEGSSKRVVAAVEATNKAYKNTEAAVRSAEQEASALAQIYKETAATRIKTQKTGFDQQRALAELDHQSQLTALRGSDKLLEAEMRRHEANLSLIAKQEADHRISVAAEEAAKKREHSFGGEIAKQAVGFGVAALGIEAIQKTTEFFSESIKAAQESAQAQADLRATLDSTGHAAGIEQAELEHLATSLQSVTRFSDESIMASEGMILTFDQIGKEIFPQVTEATLNMAQKFGGDAKQAAIQLGKALQDPLDGMTSLGREGIKFSSEQEKQIKLFLKQGDVLSAQKVILGEVDREFGGLARAMGDTDPFTKFHNQMDDLQEVLGGSVLPLLSDAAKEATKFIHALLESKDLSDFIRLFREEKGQNFDNFLPNAQKLKQALQDYKALSDAQQKARASGLTGNMSGGMAMFGFKGDVDKNVDKLKEVRQIITEIAGDTKAAAMLGDVDTALKEVSATVSTLEEKEKNRPAKRNNFVAQNKGPTKAQLDEMGAFEADEDYKAKVKLIKDEQLQRQIAVHNQEWDEEYLKERQAFEEQLDQLSQSRLSQDLNANKSHFDQLRNYAREFYIDQAELDKKLTQINKAESAARLAIYVANGRAGLDSTVSNLQTMAAKWKVFGGIYKAAAHTKNVIDTYASATASYNSLAGIPYVGVALGIAAAAAAIGAGLARGVQINAQKFAAGGIVGGNSYSGDKVPGWLNSGEMILNKNQQAALFSMLSGGGRQAPAGSSVRIDYRPEYNIHGVGNSQEFMTVLDKHRVEFGDWFNKQFLKKGYASGRNWN